MNIRFSDLVLIFAIALAGVCHAHAQDLVRETWDKVTSIPETDAYELGSLYEAFLANNSSWNSGDVLIKSTTCWDSCSLNEKYPPGSGLDDNGDLIMEVVEYQRFRFDYSENRFLYVKSSKAKIDLLVHPEIRFDRDRKNEEHQLSGIVKNKNGVFVRNLPQKTRKYKKNLQMGEFLAKYRIPELRQTGVVPLGASSDYNHLKQVVARLATGEGIVSANYLDDKLVKIVRKTGIPGNDRNQFISTTVFDTDRYVPVSDDVDVETVDVDGKSSRAMSSRDKFEWRQIDGIMVPTTIFTERHDGKIIAGHEFFTEKSEEVIIHWVSLNKDLSESEFDEVNLHDVDSMVRLAEEKTSR